MKRSILLVAALTLAGCSSTAQVQGTLIQTTSTAPSALGTIPNSLLLSSAKIFASRASLNGDFRSMFEGDRLIIVTEALLTEFLPSYSASRNVSLVYGCDRTCGLSLQELAVVLFDDLLIAKPLGQPLVNTAVSGWPAVEFLAGSHIWRISFGLSGGTIVALELFGDLSDLSMHAV